MPWRAHVTNLFRRDATRVPEKQQASVTRTGVMIALAVLVVAFRMLWGETVHEWSVILIVVLLLFAAAMVRSETREENNGDDRADD